MPFIVAALSVLSPPQPSGGPEYFNMVPLTQAVVVERPMDLAGIAEMRLARGELVLIEGEYVENTLDLWTFIELKKCETGSMPWHERGGNPRFEGPHQWWPPTWDYYGGEFAESPQEASINDQIKAVRRNVEDHGGTFSQFPGCRRKLGLA